MVEARIGVHQEFLLNTNPRAFPMFQAIMDVDARGL
jgi:hypothetical protein